MKNCVMLLLGFGLCLMCAPDLMAQKGTWREVGPRFSNLNSLGAIYKVEKTPFKYRRIRVLGANLNMSFLPNRQAAAFNFSIGVGRENRVPLSDKLLFVHGPEPFGMFNVSSRNFDNVNTTTQLGFGYVLGFLYHFSPAFYVNIETIPSASLGFSTTDAALDESFFVQAGFNSNAISITLAHRFERKK